MSSGYRPHGQAGYAPPGPHPLPPGWTEHRAPTGHMYYYHAESKTSTYTRPGAPPTELPFTPPAAYNQPQFQRNSHPNQFRQNRQHDPNTSHRPRPQEKPDKPKTKRAIPNAEPWLFVTTKKGNTFIHNPETKESLWSAPDDLKDAIEQMEKLSLSEERERERVRRRQAALERQRKEQEEAMADEYDDAKEYYEPEEEEDGTSTRGIKRQASATVEGDEGEDEDYYDDDEYFDEEHDEKRMRLEGGQVEFTEDDIAWQLGAMAEDYGLDEEDLEGAEDLPAEDGVLLFKDMLTDYRVNPYSTWENEMPKLVEDGRYTTLTTTKMRKQVFSQWCQERIAALKAEKEKEVKKDPRIAYLNFIEQNATPKLYWPEFKRKYKKEAPMKDLKVTDKDREKYYRDYISRDEKDSTKEAKEKQRRALQGREAAVRKEQYYNSKDIARGREALRETEMEIKRAMNIRKEGLLGHLEPAKQVVGEEGQ
ncbi:hypothetical protein ABW19_dt0200092 [Dactylella cylindrospora]|nr:hypothetical protein ABW19_dt0200092 [Dactylella cylindrospora]